MKTVITIEGGRITVQVDDEVPVSVDAYAQAPPTLAALIEQGLAPAKNSPGVMRQCQFCKTDISDLDVRRKICSKSDCRKAQRRYHQERYVHQQRKTTKSTAKDAVGYCRHCCTWTTHDSEGHPNPPKQKVEPRFLPGHGKTPEEIASWKPAVTGVPLAVKNIADVKADSSTSFSDPWNCDACRRRAGLCMFHQGMTDDGKLPPSKKVKRKV